MPTTKLARDEEALTDRLSFQLYAASRAMVNAYRRKLLAFDLTFPQYLTMVEVWGSEGRTVSELCAALELDSGTVSPILTRLEGEGFIRKERGGGDGRQVRVVCTDAGRELRERVSPVPRDVAASVGLHPQDFAELSGQLRALREAVREG